MVENDNNEQKWLMLLHSYFAVRQAPLCGGVLASYYWRASKVSQILSGVTQ